MNDPSALPGFATPAVTWARARLAWLLGRAAIGTMVVGLVGSAIATAFGSYGIGQAFGSGGTLAAFFMLVTSFIIWFRRGPAPGSITFDAQRVTLTRAGWGSARRIERSQIVSAYALTRYVRGAYAQVVEIELQGGDLVSLEVPGEEAARAIVDDLGFGRGKKRTHIGLGTPGRRLLHVLMALIAYYVGTVAAIPLFVLASTEGWTSAFSGIVSSIAMIAMYTFLRGLVRAPEVTIGDDGIFFRQGRKKRFLPGASITGVTQTSVALPLLIQTSHGSPLAIHGGALDIERRFAVARLAYERFMEPPAATEQGAAQFARAGRSVADWREHLRVHVGNVGYREAGSPSDVAAAVLRSSRSTSEERAGAAIALRIAGEPEERIRVAASAVADDDLRVALEAIADTSDEVVLERALRKLA